MACSCTSSSVSSCSPKKSISDDATSTASLWSMRRKKAKAARAAADDVSDRLEHIEQMLEHVLSGLSLLLGNSKHAGMERSPVLPPPGLAAPATEYFEIFDSCVDAAVQTSAWEPLPEESNTLPVMLAAVDSTWEEQKSFARAPDFVIHQQKFHYLKTIGEASDKLLKQGYSLDKVSRLLWTKEELDRLICES